MAITASDYTKTGCTMSGMYMCMPPPEFSSQLFSCNKIECTMHVPNYHHIM